jgi:heme-degrading monooxygenase HmoA
VKSTAFPGGRGSSSISLSASGKSCKKTQATIARCSYPWRMIARIWHGYTTEADAEAYASSLKAELLPGITKVAGYKGSYLLRRRCGKEIEFITVMLWDSLEALREFPGRDYEQAIVPVERRKLLSHYDERSAHYEILLHPAARDVLSSA